MRTFSLSAVLLLSLTGCASSQGPVRTAAPNAALKKETPAEALQPLDHTPWLRAKATTYMMPDELVLGVEIGGDARAYPLRILDAHGVSNDTINGIPVAMAGRGAPMGTNR